MYTLKWNDNGPKSLDFSSVSKAVDMFVSASNELPKHTGKSLEELEIELWEDDLLMLSSDTLV